jgi:hypothetical protein
VITHRHNCPHARDIRFCTDCALKREYARGHAAGKREGIEAAAKVVGDKAVRLRERAQAAYEAHARSNSDSLSVNAAALEDVDEDIRALLQKDGKS